MIGLTIIWTHTGLQSMATITFTRENRKAWKNFVRHVRKKSKTKHEGLTYNFIQILRHTDGLFGAGLSTRV